MRQIVKIAEDEDEEECGCSEVRAMHCNDVHGALLKKKFSLHHLPPPSPKRWKHQQFLKLYLKIFSQRGKIPQFCPFLGYATASNCLKIYWLSTWLSLINYKNSVILFIKAFKLQKICKLRKFFRYKSFWFTKTLSATEMNKLRWCLCGRIANDVSLILLFISIETKNRSQKSFPTFLHLTKLSMKLDIIFQSAT